MRRFGPIEDGRHSEAEPEMPMVALAQKGLHINPTAPGTKQRSCKPVLYNGETSGGWDEIIGFGSATTRAANAGTYRFDGLFSFVVYLLI